MEQAFLLNRKILNLPSQAPPLSHKTFTLLQWNALSSELGTAEAFPKANPSHLLPLYRQPLIAQEIKSYSPDFVCLEEASQIDLEFFKAIDSTNYESIYHQKTGGLDGLCLLYNKTKFDLAQSELQNYIDPETNAKQSQVFQLNIFKPKWQDNDYIMVVFTHLKAKAPFGHIRLAQLNQLVKFVEEAKGRFLEEHKDVNLGIVICGDFNDEPESEPLKYFKEKTKFNSAYEGETYTTFKIREVEKDGVKEMKVFRRVIDYVFYNDNLGLVGRSEIPAVENVDVNGFPCEGYPSDHLSLFCKFGFMK